MYEQRPLYPMPWWQKNCQVPGCAYPPYPLPMPSIGDEFIIRFLGVDCEGNALFCLKKRPAQCPGHYPPRPR